jgi:hypothetical protein
MFNGVSNIIILSFVKIYEQKIINLRKIIMQESTSENIFLFF